jgi:hypothetical protein
MKKNYLLIMYNMDISIFGFKLNVEILILIGIVYLILVGHTLCGCTHYGGFGLMEGLAMGSDNVGSKEMSDKPATITNGDADMLTQTSTSSTTTAAGNSVAGTKKGTKEGFSGANINYGQSSSYDLTNNSTVNTSSWSAQNMTVVPGQPLSQGVKDFLAREPQPVPLPEGEMVMFANTPFKPECCPNTYSTSTGCACMTGQQYNYLILRGGNNVPYSSY